MPYLAVDRDGQEAIYEQKPHRLRCSWAVDYPKMYVVLPLGTIESIIFKQLKWQDDPVELK